MSVTIESLPFAPEDMDFVKAVEYVESLRLRYYMGSINSCPACGETKTAVINGTFCFACGMSGIMEKAFTPCKKVGMEQTQLSLIHAWKIIDSGNEIHEPMVIHNA